MERIETMGKAPILVDSMFIGASKTITDDRGTWQSSIYRNRVQGSQTLEVRGFVGDKNHQPYHGAPDAAVCCHLLSHYRFWNEQYGMNLEAGFAGENLVLENVEESDLCLADTYSLGTAVVQVSGCRTPCANLARRIGRTDWVELTLKELRLGFYLRVIQPGVVAPGDPLILTERPYPHITLPDFNRCYFFDLDPILAKELIEMPESSEYFKVRLRAKLGDLISG